MFGEQILSTFWARMLPWVRGWSSERGGGHGPPGGGCSHKHSSPCGAAAVAEGGAREDGVWSCCVDGRPGQRPVSELPTGIPEGAEEKGPDGVCFK